MVVRVVLVVVDGGIGGRVGSGGGEVGANMVLSAAVARSLGLSSHPSPSGTTPIDRIVQSSLDPGFVWWSRVGMGGWENGGGGSHVMIGLMVWW